MAKIERKRTAAAESSSGTTGMKRLPSNTRRTTWDAGLSTVPLKRVSICPQDPFRAATPQSRAPLTREYGKSCAWFAKTAYTSTRTTRRSSWARGNWEMSADGGSAMRSSFAAFTVIALSLVSSAMAQSYPEVTDPVPLGGTDAGGTDRHGQITPDGMGQWIAVWDSSDSLNGTIGTDFDIFVSRSTDNGTTWTDRAPLNTNAVTDEGRDETPQVATDRARNWIAVWMSLDSLGGTIGTDWDILVARSTDNGETWTDPEPLNTNAATDSGDDSSPQVTTDGAGHWVAVWDSYGDLGGTIGTDRDILVARSADNGQTWTDAGPLNTNAATDSGDDASPQVTTDGAGRWIAVWQSYDSLNGTIGTDSDILRARSLDGGATWNSPRPMNSANTDGNIGDLHPQITTDGAGNWIAVWQSIDGHTSQGDDWNILVTRRSFADGIPWTDPEPLNTNAPTDLDNDYSPQVMTDSRGLWIAVWYAGELYNDDHDILMAHSRDSGATWTYPAPLNTNAETDTANDWNPQISTEGTGHWIAGWHAQGPGTGFDILVARLTFCSLSLVETGPTLIHFPPPSSIAAGLLSELRTGRDFAEAACLGTFVDSPVPDPIGDPPVGDGYYYLARGDGHCASYGDSSLDPDPRDDLDLADPCP
jgi:hypothetical protein